MSAPRRFRSTKAELAVKKLRSEISLMVDQALEPIARRMRALEEHILDLKGLAEPANDVGPGDTLGRSVMEDELERSRSKNRIVGEGLERAAREIKTLPVFDNWQHRSAGMRCSTCMFYVPKAGLGPSPLNGEQLVERGRCRRHAPSMNGWPVLLPSDWCGEHKLA
jgi:hypothetical protein